MRKPNINNRNYRKRTKASLSSRPNKIKNKQYECPTSYVMSDGVCVHQNQITSPIQDYKPTGKPTGGGSREPCPPCCDDPGTYGYLCVYSFPSQQYNACTGGAFPHGPNDVAGSCEGNPDGSGNNNYYWEEYACTCSSGYWECAQQCGTPDQGGGDGASDPYWTPPIEGEDQESEEATRDRRRGGRIARHKKRTRR
jgi:hypothetical protein